MIMMIIIIIIIIVKLFSTHDKVISRPKSLFAASITFSKILDTCIYKKKFIKEK